MSGVLSRKDYAEVWAAAMIIMLLVASSVLGGWLTLPSPDSGMATLEQLPRLAGLCVPAGTCLWAVFAATLRRCRDALFPLQVYVGLCLLLATTVGIDVVWSFDHAMLDQALHVVAAFCLALITILSIALAGMETILLFDPPSFEGMARPERAPQRRSNGRRAFGRRQ